jgi:hypothetical protein
MRRLRHLLRRGWLAAIFLWLLNGSFVHAADYLEPKVLTGTIYEFGSKQVLFFFKRTATNSGNTIRVSREYSRPDGALAAREEVVYESGKLSSYQLEELDRGIKGSAIVRPDQQKIVFNFVQGKMEKTDSEKIQKDVLVGDMVAPFIADHWSELMSGAAVKCRQVAVSRVETVGFKFVKESETIWQGKPAVIIKMEPTSFIIAQFIDPLRFTIEKDGAHHVLQYTGRVTPSLRKKDKWEDVDALTVFDWK